MPNIRARLVETIRDAYPENFEGLDPSKTLGENVFGGPKPHPNTVLNFFVQQNIASALPIAYYMAVRGGLDSLMDARLLPSAKLSEKALKSAMRGLITLRDMELKEIHQIFFTLKDTTKRSGCSLVDCPTRSSKGLLDVRATGAHRGIFDRITGSAVGGTRILQVLSVGELTGDTGLEFCQVCAEKIQAAHAEVRRKAWAVLPEVFGLKV